MKYSMKSVRLVNLSFVLVLALGLSANAQSNGRGKPYYHPKPKPVPECNLSGLSTTVMKVEQLEGGCTKYTFSVTTNGTCRYDLSHYTVAIPCGTVQDISNSRQWKQEVGTDPTTGLTGFKIDDVPSFGKEEGDSFLVEFTVCGDEQCTTPPTEVAYKAGQCIKYETIEYPDDHDDGDDDTDHDDDDEDDGEDDDDNDNDNGGGDGGGGNDDGTTCSTLQALLLKTDINCSGNNNGMLAVEVQDGNQPITFKWSTGASDQSILNLTPGFYSVTVTDADGNTLTLSSTIAESQPLVIEGATTNPSCSTSQDGAIALTVTGGTGAYTYLWNTTTTTENLTNLNAGTYSVTVTDEAGCTQQKSFQLINTTQINLTAITTKTNCGQANGAVDLTVTGGASPYTYVWTNGATTEDLSSLGAGSYRVVVTDANGCQSIGTYFVQEINTLRVTFQVAKANCTNDPIGSIDLTVSGGVGPYTYQWQHGPTTEDVSGLVAGTYRVTVTDQAGCATLAVILVQKETLQINAQVIQPSCADDPTGSIQLTPINGSGSYTYEWSNGEAGSTLVDVAVGTYVVIVTDNTTGCSVTLSYTIAAPSPITAIADIQNGGCGQEGNYSITLAITGGRAPYQVLWSNGITGPALTGLSSGTYQAQIRDVNGCVISKDVIVDASLFTWNCLISPIEGISVCQSVGNFITAAITDADSYLWSIESSDNSWSITAGHDASAAVYTVGNPGSTATFSLVVVKDGCEKMCSYQVESACEVRDNTGGGDPGNNDPCSPVVTPPTGEDEPNVEDEKEDSEENESDDHEGDDSDPKLCAYPNPFEGKLSFNWKAIHDDHVRLEVYDQYGRMVRKVYEGDVRKGENYSADWECDNSEKGLFFYRYVSNHHKMKGKVLRK